MLARVFHTALVENRNKRNYDDTAKRQPGQLRMDESEDQKIQGHERQIKQALQYAGRHKVPHLNQIAQRLNITQLGIVGVGARKKRISAQLAFQPQREP